LGFVSILLLLIYFPTGTLPSRRWWVLPFVEILGALASAIASLFMPGSPVQPPVPGLVNPLGRPDWAPALQVFNTIGQLTLVPVMIGCVVLLAVRIRRSEGVERQQLKWFGWATGVVTALLLVSLSVPLLGLTVIPFADAVWNLTLSSLVLLPAAAAIAILRYRLFDIDRLISRTVSYAILTAVLAVVYVAGFLGLQAVLSSVTESEGPVAVAASTLAVFALFTPVRRRIQAVVDRRFNRARYDAQQSAEAFAGRIRDEVNIEQLSAEVVRVLERTVQPASAGIWLRPSERVRRTMTNRLPSATGTNQIVSGPGSRSAAWLARSVWLVSVAFLVVFLGYGLVSPANAARTGTLANAVAFLAFVLAFSTLGGLVASKRPGHPIGWLLLASALCYSVGGLSVSLPQPTGGGLSPALFAQWAGTWAWGVGVGLAVVVLLLFPDGRLPSRRWRPVLWLAIGVMLAIVLGVGFGSPFIGDSRVPNPFALGGSVGEVLGALDAAFPLLLLVALLAVVSVIVRWRRAREIERQQIKWLLYPALLVGLGLVAQVPLLTLSRLVGGRDRRE